jgi:HTH-type transcriptional regulator / antitoxin HipB
LLKATVKAGSFLTGNPSREGGGTGGEKMHLAQEVGKQVKTAREAKGWTQEDLAKRCGVGKAQISKIERDIRHASMGLFLKVCEAFGVDLRLVDETGESLTKVALSYWEMLEDITGENIKKYIVELGKPVAVRGIPHPDIGKALDAVVKFTLRTLKIAYLPGKQEYDYYVTIGDKIILINWKMGNLQNDDYRMNCLNEVTRAFEETHAHEYIITIPDYPAIAEEMNNARYRKNLVFVPINSLGTYLKRYMRE